MLYLLFPSEGPCFRFLCPPTHNIKQLLLLLFFVMKVSYNWFLLYLLYLCAIYNLSLVSMLLFGLIPILLFCAQRHLLIAAGLSLYSDDNNGCWTRLMLLLLPSIFKLSVSWTSFVSWYILFWLLVLKFTRTRNIAVFNILLWQCVSSLIPVYY